MARALHRTRHWKQVYRPDARFVWTKSGIYSGSRRCVPGEEIPSSIDRNKRRRLWEARWIALHPDEEDKPRQVQKKSRPVPEPAPIDQIPGLYDFDKGMNVPPGESIEEPVVREAGGGWFTVAFEGSTKKVQGQKQLNKLLKKLKSED